MNNKWIFGGILILVSVMLSSCISGGDYGYGPRHRYGNFYGYGDHNERFRDYDRHNHDEHHQDWRHGSDDWR